MVSYNDCPFIRELYEGCYIHAVSRLNNLAQRYEEGASYPEVIITSYNPKTEGRGERQEQMEMFE